MSNVTGSRAAACVLGVPPACRGVDLPDYRVIDAFDTDEGHRLVHLEGVDDEAACPTCGVLSDRVHQRFWQRLRDVPITGPAGDLRVLLRKRRFACAEPACPRRTFTEASDQLPARERLTTRLRAALLGRFDGWPIGVGPLTGWRSR